MNGKMAEEKISQCFSSVVPESQVDHTEGVAQGGSLRVQVWAG